MTNTQNILNKWQTNETKRNLVGLDLFHNRQSLHQQQRIDNDAQKINNDNKSSFSSQNEDRKTSELKSNSDEKSSQAHSRKKRLVWVTDDGRLALPPGTVLSITPTLSLPLVRYPLSGFLSNITVSFPLTSNKSNHIMYNTF